MKRLTLALLIFMMIILFLSSAFSEGIVSVQQAIESIASGAADSSCLDALLSSLPDTSGAVVIQTWEDADGKTYTFVYYTGAADSDPAGLPAANDAPTAQELLRTVDWVESQVRTEALDGSVMQEALDPAVFSTAQPQPAPTVDPAVFYTAQPQPAPTIDPAVFYTAQPQPAPTVDPAVFSTAQPEPVPSPRPRPAAQPTVQPAPQPTVPPETLPTVSTGDYTTFDSSMQEQILLNLLNQDRARNGLPSLALDPELSRLAKLKSSDMNSNHYFAHESPTYGNAGQMLDSFHYDYQGVGENIAHYGSVEKAEAAFMSSDGHRRNILGSQWEKVGIGVTYDENGNVYVTQLFAR